MSPTAVHSYSHVSSPARRGSTHLDTFWEVRNLLYITCYFNNCNRCMHDLGFVWKKKYAKLLEIIQNMSYTAGHKIYKDSRKRSRSADVLVYKVVMVVAAVLTLIAFATFLLFSLPAYAFHRIYLFFFAVFSSSSFSVSFFFSSSYKHSLSGCGRTRACSGRG